MEVYRRKTGATVAPDEYFDFDTRSVDLNPTRKTADFRRFFRRPAAAHATFDEWGCGSVPGSMEHFVEYKFHPLQSAATADDVRAFPWPDVTADYRYEGLAERIAEYHRRGYAVTGELYMTIFERAWLMRGMEQLLMDFLAEPEIGHAICQCIADLRIEQARRLAALGVDVLRLGDDVCTQKGLADEPRHVSDLSQGTDPSDHPGGQGSQPRPAGLHALRRPGGRHDRGIRRHRRRYPQSRAAGVQRSGGDRPADPADASPSGAASAPRARCRLARPAMWRPRWPESKQALGRNGGLLVAPTHILEPEVPWDNVLAFVEAARNSFYD